MSLDEKPLPQDFVVDESIAEAIRAHLKDGKLPCAQAFKIAAEHQVEPLQVGQTADALRIHLTRCQLGLYGYPGHQKGWAVTNIAEHPVPEGLEEALRETINEEGCIPCVKAWEIAAQFNIPKMHVGYVASQLDLRISPCQLGAF